MAIVLSEPTSVESPFTALHYHFGMLLGVDDFETEQDYHRGKMRLHNAWLHREGVVWGLAVSADLPSGELRVERGLALDPAGHELHLDARACVNVGAWYDEHADDPDLDATVNGPEVTFDARVVARFRSCLTRPVPAFADPCEGAQSETAYSRELETVELLLAPGLADRPGDPYHRLRLLFALAGARTADDGSVIPADQEVLDARAAIRALPEAARPRGLLDAFRRFAALDVIDLAPSEGGEDGDEEQDGQGLFPAGDAAPLLLANVKNVTLNGAAGAWTLTKADVDNTIRSAHVATRTIQELLCGGLTGAILPVASPTMAAEVPATGPRIERDSVRLRARKLTLRSDGPLMAASVTPKAFAVAALTGDGWSSLRIDKAELSARDRTVTLSLRSAGDADVLRVIAHGTGLTPLLGRDGVPLAGADDEPGGGEHDGADFVHMLKRR
jgi:hypothetical protein